MQQSHFVQIESLLTVASAYRLLSKLSIYITEKLSYVGQMLLWPNG